MEESQDLFDGVIFPSDFSQGSLAGFYHALYLALGARSHLRMVHVNPTKASTELSQFPRVRDTIARWRALPQRATEADLSALGVSVHKTVARSTDPISALKRIIKKYRHNLLVLTPHQHSGLAGLFHKSRSLALLHYCLGYCLLLPHLKPGLIDADGKLTLDHVLMPVHHGLDLNQLLEALKQFCDRLGREQITVHMQPLDTFPRPDLKSLSDPSLVCHWRDEIADSADEIVAAAHEVKANLIAFVLSRPSGWWARFRTDPSEQLINLSPCALLKFPRQL